MTGGAPSFIARKTHLRLRRTVLGAAGVLLIAALSDPLSSQEAAIPTQEDRGIYGLAVDSATYPGQPLVVLLDEGLLRVEEDGTLLRRFRMVRQILHDGAADAAAELSFSYDPSREEFELDWARVVDHHGDVVSLEPVHVQEMDEPVARRSPVYTERKRVRASLGDVTPGSIVDWQYTLRVADPHLPGDFWLRWSVNGSRPVQRSRLTVDVPLGMDARFGETNLPGPTGDRARDGRRVREWSYDTVAAYEPEPFAAESNGVQQSVVVSGALGWDDIARWYDELSRHRYRLSPELEGRLAAVVAGAVSLDDSLRAVHRWVAQDVRYVSIALGLGGYQPRSAAAVAESGVGDCKDKTTLFLALVRHLGVEGHPVLVSTGQAIRTDLPFIYQFNHMVAAIRPGNEWIYLDLTVPVAPFDEVFGSLQGRTGVMLRGGGVAEPVRFPISDVTRNRSSIVVEGSLSEDGRFEGTYTEVVTGAIQYRIRAEFARPLTDQQRGSVARGIARRVFDDARTDSLELFDGSDLGITPRLWAGIQADDVLRQVPGGWMLPLRLARYGSAETVARLEEHTVRRFPIDAERVFGRRVHHTEYRILLPEGWRADLPNSVRIEGVFGSYESTYEQAGRELLVSRRIQGTDTVVSPDRKDELVEWLTAMWDDHVEFIVLRAPPS